MAKSFLKKNPGKGMGGIVQQSATRSAGTIAAAYAANNLLTRFPFIKPNMKGAVMLALGMAGEVLLDNDTARNFAEGVTSYGALQTTGDLILGAKKSQLGLGGIEEGDYEDVTRPQIGAANSFDWGKALSGAREELDNIEGVDGLEGAEDDDDISGTRKRSRSNETASVADLLS